MKYVNSVAAAGALLWLVGCSSAPNATVHQSAGPALAGRPETATQDSLQAYSASERAFVDLNAEEFLANNDFGRNVRSYQPANNEFTIRAHDGQVANHVPNSGN
jgi:hypothetical protein